MVLSCIIPSCSSKQAKEDVSFHRFPKERSMFSKWKSWAESHGANLNGKNFGSIRICCKHFTAESYASTLKKILKSDAVPSMYTNEESSAGDINLGRCTKRGVRNCPRCGTRNGTKSFICKNTSCGVRFRSRKLKLGMEACKLETGALTEVFSVCIYEKEFEQRGFVQLPFVQDIEGLDSHGLVTPFCFIDSCHRSFSNSSKKCHKTSQTPDADLCNHVSSALKCTNIATSFAVNAAFVNDLLVSDDIKQKLCSLMTESAAPLVQRVSKTSFVIRCKTSSRHPLGFLHLLIFVNEAKLHYACQCPDFEIYLTIERYKSRRCVHYYAWYCVVHSDAKLRQEFIGFINSEASAVQSGKSPEDAEFVETEKLIEFVENSTNTVRNRLIEIMCTRYNKVLMVRDKGNSVTNNSSSVSDADVQPFKQSVRTDVNPKAVNDEISEEVIKRKCESENDTSRKKSFNEVITKGNTDTKKITPLRKIAPKPPSMELHTVSLFLKVGDMDAKKTEIRQITSKPRSMELHWASVNFSDWLASITEQIKYQMHYKFSGDVKILKFHAQHIFFDCLLERIRDGVEERDKNRMPDSLELVEGNDMPDGSYIKYTWRLTSASHVTKIFDNPILPLSLTRYFRKGKKNVYVDCDSENMISNASIPMNFFATFLKIGKTEKHSAEVTPFVIEWIPDVLPISKVGILKISFEYGHMPPLEQH